MRNPLRYEELQFKRGWFGETRSICLAASVQGYPPGGQASASVAVLLRILVREARLNPGQGIGTTAAMNRIGPRP